MTKEEKKEHFKKLGAKGGKKTAELYGKKHYQKLAALSNKAQWGD